MSNDLARVTSTRLVKKAALLIISPGAITQPCKMDIKRVRVTQLAYPFRSWTRVHVRVLVVEHFHGTSVNTGAGSQHAHPSRLKRADVT